MANLRILLTGGHAGTTGVAVVEELRKLDKTKNSQIYWIGTKTAIEGGKTQTLESQVFPKLGVNFYPITAGKLQTKFTIYTIPSILKIPIGFIQSFIAIIKIKPKVILSFGGFSSFPVVFWGKLFGIPTIIHEQTVAVGRAFLASVPFASRILLGHSESKNYLGNRRTEVVGNPLMSSVLLVKPKASLPKRPTILIIGGSRGSNFLNELTIKIVEGLLVDFNVVHITGETDYEAQLIFKKSLDNAFGDNYAIYSKVNPQNMKDIYQNVDLVISRSGANTVSELIFIKKPTIFIPLPRTHLDEQVKNAEFAVNYGLGVVLSEKEASASRVLEEIKKLVENWDKINKNLKNKYSPDIDASKKIAEIVSEYC